MPTTIAVVNDDIMFLTLMRELLRDEGYRATTLRAAEGAYECISVDQPDLVVLDIRVGREAEGWTLLDLIRLDPRTTHIPVIICSTDPRMLAAKQDWLRERRCDVLEKPFDLSDILDKIDAFVGRASAEAAD